MAASVTDDDFCTHRNEEENHLGWAESIFGEECSANACRRISAVSVLISDTGSAPSNKQKEIDSDVITSLLPAQFSRGQMKKGVTTTAKMLVALLFSQLPCAFRWRAGG